jgi:hypothetical protein
MVVSLGFRDGDRWSEEQGRGQSQSSQKCQENFLSIVNCQLAIL